MKRFLCMTAMSGALALGAACSDSGPECGVGTAEVDGKCVPTADDISCASGTTLVGTECVPDGSVICETGTTFNSSTGKCDPDISGCAPGTVQSGDQCIPTDEGLTADITEPAEPNGPGDDGAAVINLPEVGASTTIMGCITPTSDTQPEPNGNLDPDLDAYVFTTTGPAVIDVTVDGLGGLAGGFQVLSAENDLVEAGWTRLGLTMVSDTARRKVYLPGAGVYALAIGDSRSFLTGEGAGNTDTCYYATLTHEAVPAATPIVADTPVTGPALGDLQVYSFDPTDGAVVFSTLVANSESLAGGAVVMVNDTFRYASTFQNMGDDAFTAVAGLGDNDKVTIVTDYVISYSLSDVPFELTVNSPSAPLAPADGSAVSVTTEGNLYRWMYFDVNDGEVVYMNVNTNGGDKTEVTVIDSNFNLVTQPCVNDGWTDTTCNEWDGWVQFVDAGRYYIRLFNSEPAPTNCGDGTVDTDEQCDDGNTADGDGCNYQCKTEPYAWDVYVTRVAATPGVVSVGTASSGQTLANDELGFHELDVSSSDWLSFQATPTGFTGAVALTFYDRTKAGELGVDVPSLDSISLADASDDAGRIVIDDSSVFLVSVGDAGGTGSGKMYDLSVADRVYTDLGMLDPMNPANLTGVSLAAGETAYYLARAATSYTVDVSVTGGAGIDPVLTRIDNEEGTLASYDDNTGAATSEAFSQRMASAGWVAFVVEDVAGTAGMFDMDATASPPPYTSAAGSLTYSDVCTMGAAHTISDDDEGLSSTPITLPITFSFFGDSVTELVVSSNGWASFDSSVSDAEYANKSIPTDSAPNSIIAPLWDDLENTTVCTYHDTTSNTFTIQWNGHKYNNDGQVVEMQAVLHQDGTIDFIYGSGHNIPTDSATIGVENAAGDNGLEVSYNTAGAVAAGDSLVLTPTP
jgi:cysteine-rich repeat protein